MYIPLDFALMNLFRFDTVNAANESLLGGRGGTAIL